MEQIYTTGLQNNDLSWIYRLFRETKDSPALCRIDRTNDLVQFGTQTVISNRASMMWEWCIRRVWLLSQLYLLSCLGPRLLVESQVISRGLYLIEVPFCSRKRVLTMFRSMNLHIFIYQQCSEESYSRLHVLAFGIVPYPQYLNLTEEIEGGWIANSTVIVWDLDHRRITWGLLSKGSW